MPAAKSTTADAATDAAQAAAPAVRRSTRVASGAAAKAVAQPKKRVASKKTKAKNVSSDMKELESKMRATKIGSGKDSEPKPKPPKELKEPKEPYFNPLPALDPPSRPALLLYTWGCGNSGQFGAGVDYLGEQTKPQRNKLIDAMVEQGKFGEKDAGIQYIAAGGMSSLFIDDKGVVCEVYHSFLVSC